MLILGIVGFSLLTFVALVYALYFHLVLRNKKSIGTFAKSIDASQLELTSDSNLANVSVIISTYNEAKVIARKIRNISQLNYPKNHLEIIVYDDSSSDQTGDIADRAFKDNALYGKVIRSTSRIGLNRSLNAAVSEARHNLVCITDSDVLLEKNALRNAVKVLEQYEGAGGVTGHVQPVFEGEGVAQSSESSYRGFYHKSMLAESSLHSAFPGNGPLIVFDKSKVPHKIPQDFGSTDGNIAINVIRQGLRFIYVPNSTVYEPSAENLEEHRLQKVRRAKRLLQVFIKNRDIAFNKKYGRFGSTIFPLKMLMMAICPLLIFLSVIFLILFVLLSQNIIFHAISGTIIVLGLVSVIASKRAAGFLSSFILHQGYLVVGLFSSFRKSVYWKTIDRKTKISFG